MGHRPIRQGGRTRIVMAGLAALALLAAACSSDIPTAPTQAPTQGSAEPVREAPAPPVRTEVPVERTIGEGDVHAASAPEWVANGTVGVRPIDGSITVAQLLSPERPFDLEALIFESLGVDGVAEPTDVGFTFSVHLAPDELPERFDAADLPVLGRATGSMTLGPLDWAAGGDFFRLPVEEPFAVPEQPVLVVLILRLPEGLEDVELMLAGRRGAVGGVAACMDHNPGGRLLERMDLTGEVTLPLEPVPDGRAPIDRTCAAEGPAAGYNMTMFLEGRRLAPEAAAAFARGLPRTPTVVALEPRPEPEPGPVTGGGAAPDTTQAAPPRAAAPSAPSGPAVKLRTLPAGFRGGDGDDGLAAFWWGPTGYPEIGQTVLVREPFELTELNVGMQRASALPDWLNAPEERISWEHDVLWTGIVPSVRFRITIWPVPDGRADAIDVAGIPALVEQYVTTDVPITGFRWGPTANEWVRLRLDAPVALGTGHHLVSLAIDDLGPHPEVFNFYVYGSNYGFTDRGGFNQSGVVIACDYPVAPERYTDGRLYYRVFSSYSRQTPLSNATTLFREHRAKVISRSLEPCSGRGMQDAFLPGDLDLVLRGR